MGDIRAQLIIGHYTIKICTQPLFNNHLKKKNYFLLAYRGSITIQEKNYIDSENMQ